MKHVDLVIKNAFVYNTFLQKFEKKDIAVVENKFYYIGNQCELLEAKEVIDFENKYIIPGLIDIHMHIESSMTIPSEFSKIVLSHGVTTVVADPHEIANVFGIKGIQHYLSSDTLLDIFYGIPSSVPTMNSKLETSGGSITPKDVAILLNNPKVLCLGEVMNFKEVISNENTTIKQIIEECKKERPFMPIEGHCPKIEGLELAEFMYAGVDADHTQQTPKSIYEKVTSGMFLELQKKSLTVENIEVIIQHNFFEYIALITDDVMADDLIKGHLNSIIKKAISLGMPPEKAIYCSTYTPSRRMNLTDRGCIVAGKIADFIVLDDLNEFKINSVFKNGKKYKKHATEKVKFPDEFYHSIQCKKAEELDFIIHTSSKKEVLCNVMKIEPHSTFTKRIQRKFPVRDGKLCWENQNVSLLTCFERFGKNGNVSHAFVEGAISQVGAVATSWSHDCHNLLVLGTNVESMILAQRKVLELQGGYVVYDKSKLSALANLNIGGIISDQKIEDLAKQLQEVRFAMKQLGYKHDNEIMSLSTLTLPVSPEIKLTDFGLLNVKEQSLIPLVCEERIKHDEKVYY